MKRAAVVNNICLKRLSRRRGSFLLHELQDRLGAVIIITEYKGQIPDIRERLAGFDTIISAGGDGNLFEIINTIGISGRRFGIIPIGAGNSLAYDLGIDSTQKALGAIDRGMAREVDIAEVSFIREGERLHRYFTATAGMGFFADIARYANGYLKRLGGLCYPAATFLKTFKRERIKALISLDGLSFEEEVFTNMLINNTAHISGIRVFPEASLEDKRLNAWFSRTNMIGQLLWELGVITATYLYYPGFRYASERVYIRPSRPVGLMLDGEVFDSITEADFSVSESEGLSVLC